MQKKHVNEAVTAHAAATEMYALGKLSKSAAVAMFYALTHNEPVLNRAVRTALRKRGLLCNLGHASRAAIEARVALQVALQDRAGCNLLPELEPTNIITQGHKLVKGKSRLTREVREAEETMINTGFSVNPVVWAYVLANPQLWAKQDKLIVQVLHGFLNKTMYFPVSYDYRGRMYYRGGVITPQGNDMLKGLLQFADEAPIGKNGRVAIQRALYDAMDIKGSRDYQLAQLEATGLQDALDGKHGYLALQLAAELEDIQAWVSEGKVEAEYVSGVVCHQDATCSGLQIASAITGHRPTAEATNCTESSVLEEKCDVYQLVCDDIAKTDTQLAAFCEQFGRSLVKKSVMTMGYGAGEDTLVDNCCEYLKKQDIDYTFTAEERKILMDVLDRHCGATNALKNALQDLAKVTKDIAWKTADGFHAIQEKITGDIEKYESVSMEFDKVWDEGLNVRALSPNYVHSHDAAQMRFAIRRLGSTPVAAIHDSLGTRPCDYFRAAGAVRRAFQDINCQSLAADFLGEHGIRLPLLGDYQPNEAEKSAWFWC